MISEYVDKIKTGKSLQSNEAEQCLNTILEKDVPDQQIAKLLIALSEKGETADEILGFSRALLAKSRPVPLPSNAIDSCGTGGSGLNRFNVSTTAAFVLSAGGVPVIKHGNKGSKRPNGSFDLLEELGCKFDFEDDSLQRVFARTNVCFLFARTYHPVRTPKSILDLVCLNAGAAFYCFGRTDSIKEGFDLSKDLFARGLVQEKFLEYKRLSNGIN